MEEEQLYTVKEIAAKLRVSIQAVRRYIAEGHLRAVTLPGGYYRISESELDKILTPVKKGAGDDNGKHRKTHA